MKYVDGSSGLFAFGASSALLYATAWVTWPPLATCVFGVVRWFVGSSRVFSSSRLRKRGRNDADSGRTLSRRAVFARGGTRFALFQLFVGVFSCFLLVLYSCVYLFWVQ